MYAYFIQESKPRLNIPVCGLEIDEEYDSILPSNCKIPNILIRYSNKFNYELDVSAATHLTCYRLHMHNSKRYVNNIFIIRTMYMGTTH